MPNLHKQGMLDGRESALSAAPSSDSRQTEAEQKDYNPGPKTPPLLVGPHKPQSRRKARSAAERSPAPASVRAVSSGARCEHGRCTRCDARLLRVVPGLGRARPRPGTTRRRRASHRVHLPCSHLAPLETARTEAGAGDLSAALRALRRLCGL